jgi:hypothetical protein
VTMTTTAFVDSASVIVTVINFSADGQQIGTDTVGFDGPFAGGQVFTQQGTPTALLPAARYQTWRAPGTSATPTTAQSANPPRRDRGGAPVDKGHPGNQAGHQRDETLDRHQLTRCQET